MVSPQPVIFYLQDGIFVMNRAPDRHSLTWAFVLSNWRPNISQKYRYSMTKCWQSMFSISSGSEMRVSSILYVCNFPGVCNIMYITRAELSRYPVYIWEPHFPSIRLPEIPRVTLISILEPRQPRVQWATRFNTAICIHISCKYKQYFVYTLRLINPLSPSESIDQLINFMCWMVSNILLCFLYWKIML